MGGQLPFFCFLLRRQRRPFSLLPASPRPTHLCSPHLSSPLTQATGGMEQVGSAYANALVEAAQSKGALDAVHADVDALQVGD